MKHSTPLLIAFLLVSSFTVYAQFSGLTYASATSEAVRVDLRDGFGGRVVRGSLALSMEEGAVTCEGQALGALWNTAMLSEGWHTLACGGETAQVCVRNDSSIALEEGRLAANVTWNNSAVHVVRNDVYVPNGVTLNISEGAIVKFAENCRIIVEYGGKIAVNGNADAPVQFAQVADDGVGGDTDLREAAVVAETASRIYCYENGGWQDNGAFVVNQVVIGTLPKLSVQAVRAMRQGGSVRIPVTVSGTRNSSFAVDWQAVDGTAKYGVDFTANSGRVNWSSTSAGTGYIEIPLVTEVQSNEDVAFTVRLARSYGASIQTATALVTIYDNGESEFENLRYATATSSAVRLDLRDDFGGRIARGVMAMSNEEGEVRLNGNALGEEWDTTTMEDGWVTLEQGGETRDVAILNTMDVHCEEGRLASSTTWDNSAVRLVRNNVYIPNGVTLTVTAGTTVKFTAGTRIIVENGGKLQMNGTADAYVQFAMATDDGYAGDTDMREMETVFPSYSVIYSYANGTVADNGYVASRGLVISSTYPTLALNSVSVYEDCGTVYIPVTVSGSRNTSFYVEWEASNGTATFGEDYNLASGKLTWNSTNDGTRYIAIPISAGHLVADEETFTVRLVASGGANINTTAKTVAIRRRAESGLEDFAHATYTSNAARLDLREGFGGRIVRGTMAFSTTEGKVNLDGNELPSNWNSTAKADGWYELSQNNLTAEVCLLNNEGIALEEGRIMQNTTWNGASLHLLRNDVYVPNGVTLTIADGAIVKFTEDTRIIVENGGKLSVQGTENAPVRFALATDDVFGGDTDMREAEMPMPSKSLIYCYNTSNGWADNGHFALRKLKLNALPTVSIYNSCAVEHEGVVKIPVTVSGTRNAAFSVDWTATEGSAKLNSDYTRSSGRLSWTSTDNGTRYIEIPLVADDIAEELEDFTVSLTASYGTNIASSESTVSIFESAATLPAEAEYGSSTCEMEVGVDVDERTDLFSRLARDVEILRFSTSWAKNESASSVRISMQLDEDNETPQVIHASNGDENEGAADWNTYSLPTGRYLLAHETLDAHGGLLERLETNFFINREVIIHEGRLVEDENWDASAIHVVRANVTVPAGVLLTISEGAIVKFQSGCGIIAKLGSVVECMGSSFTHIADDTIGGDTNLDGMESLPSYDAYSIGGEGTVRMDSACKQYCKSATLPSGTLRQNTTLAGNLVYKATGSLTIASGVKLTIEPGAILKFGSGQGITVGSGATLEALGTRAQSIVFTSIKDDAYGGDTNQDGANSTPNPGDWAQITNSGTVIMNNCKILYPAGANNQGGLYNGGELDFQNGEIAHTVYDCLRSVGGNAYIANTVLHDTSMGFAPSGGSNLMVNSIIYDATTCVRWPNATFVNCIFAYSNEIVDTSFGTGMSFRNCVFWNEPASGQQSCHAVGSNGNLWVDPLFSDIANGDYSLKAASPCIDAGDGTQTTELDYWGKPRMNCTKINDTGIASENGCIPDIGIYEYPGTGGGDVPDLKVNWVNGPSVAVSGENIIVSWQIENVGLVNVQGYWHDSVFLCSADDELGQQVVELGGATGYEILYAGEKKTIIRQCRIPAIMPGKWRLRVTVNDNLDIFERNFQNNRAEGEESIDIQVEAWRANKPYALASGEDIVFEATEAMLLELTGQYADVLDWRCGVGFIPTDTHFSATKRTLNNGRVVMAMPSQNGKTTFIKVTNSSSMNAMFQIGSIDMVDAICDVNPASLPRQKLATLDFVLLDPSPVKSVQLTAGARKIFANGISSDAAGRTGAAFNLAEQEAGEYGLEIMTASGTVYRKENAVAIVGDERKARLEAWLDISPSVREGRQYIGYVCYRNSGDADMNAPVFRVIGEGNTKVKAKLSGELENVVLLYGICENPVNVLRAGEEGRVPFYFTFTGSCSVKFDTMAFPEEEYSASETFDTWKAMELAVHKAALRLHEQGKDETDFRTLYNLASRMTSNHFSYLSGHAYHSISSLPLPNVTISAVATIGGEEMHYSTVTDEEGYFVFDCLPSEATYHIALEMGETREDVIAIPALNQDVNNLQIYGLPLGSIQGYVCMNDGQPIWEEYTVELYGGDNGLPLKSVRVDENGFFVFR
ncbi:MAG: hypothetical protein J5746_03190, partial [Victivallales bacterium]|nr:hypothetical protein [Victivallales bacterium]